MFDYGYAIEAFRQAPARMPGRGVAGSPLVEHAAGETGDPAMPLALAMISVHPRRKTLDSHLRRALEGAEPGSLLEANILLQLEERGGSIAALRKSTGIGELRWAGPSCASPSRTEAPDRSPLVGDACVP